jgi:hypothetical protein
MKESDLEPGTSEPSLDELRRMIEAKDLERERERKRLSGLATKILIVGVLAVVVGILCTPGREKPGDPAGGPDPDLAATAAQIQERLSNPLDGGGLNPDAGAVERDSRKGDLKFAMDLLRYVQPEAHRTTAPSKPPEQEAAGSR